jgi:hypothetical protein
VVLLFGYANIDYVNSETDDLEEMMTMILTSTAFTYNGEIAIALKTGDFIEVKS